MKAKYKVEEHLTERIFHDNGWATVDPTRASWASSASNGTRMH